MKNVRLLAALLCLLTITSQADSILPVRGLTDANHISGPKLSLSDLEGKLIFIEFWGRSCPPCIGSLPHIQMLYQTLGDNENFVLIGSHCQSRNDESIRALLAKYGVKYSVYQGVQVDGVSIRGIPHIAVIDHKGNIIYSRSGDYRSAISLVHEKIGDVPNRVPGLLIGDLELKAFASLREKLVFGYNVESHALRLRTAAKQNTPAGKEAAAILDACEKARTAYEKNIREAITKTPGAALTMMTKFSTTWPSQKAIFADDIKKLNANAEVKRVQRFAIDYERFATREIKNKGMAKTLLNDIKFRRSSYAKIVDSPDPAVSSEAKDLLRKLDELVTKITADAA